MKHKKHLLSLFLGFCVVFSVVEIFGNSQELFNENLLKNFTYRNLGPFKVNSWIVDIAVPEFPEKAL